MPGVIRAYGNELRGKGSEMFRFDKTDFVGAAKSMGCVGMRAETPTEFNKAMKEALKANRPVVIDAVTDINAMPQKPWV